MNNENKVPKGFADRMELLAKEGGERLFQRRKAMLESLGERPYKGTPISPEQKRGEYNAMRHDPDAWYAFLAEQVRVKPDGRVLVKKGVMKEAAELESEFREGTL